ncbi:putative transporter [Yarrowia sp. C11]|nr:putative transporter [Yarrowia sp. E02]KAG5373462.1 putative transporter [Yarrowia sp. C11]
MTKAIHESPPLGEVEEVSETYQDSPSTENEINVSSDVLGAIDASKDVSSEEGVKEKINVFETSVVEKTIKTADEMFPNINKKKLLLKMDLNIIPILALLYLLSFLDRGNVGNANIEGLSVDLKLKGNEYNLCLTVFFFTYSAFEVPSNMLLKKLRPSIWLPLIMVCWGVVMTLMGLVKNYYGLLICRIFLGLTEAGLYPGVTYYLTLWYCRAEIQFRQAMFFSAASVAGAFSGLLAFAIGKMRGVAGLYGWQWIFILEGIATVLVACVAFFFVHDFPETARFLTEEEREYVMWRLKYDSNDSSNSGQMVEENNDRDWKYVRAAFKDIQVYVHILLYFGIVVPLYGISLFLPSIINGLGFTSAVAQLLTIPIYALGAIASVTQAWFSDRYGKRSHFVGANLFFMLLGYLLAYNLSTISPAGVYVGCYLIALGLYPAFPAIVSWMANNVAGSYKRAVAMAIQIGIGNLAGAIASNIYRAKDKPGYKLGHGMEIMFVCIGIAALGVLNYGYHLANKKKAEKLAAGEYDNYTPQQLSEMGDRSPYFKYRH